MDDNWRLSMKEGSRPWLAALLGAALERADPGKAVPLCLRLEGRDSLVVEAEGRRLVHDLGLYDRVFLVGFGKASARMARAVEGVLGDRISGGIVVTKRGHGERLERASLLEAAHPLPDASSEEAARALLAFAEGCGERDLVISCVSGGGSALLCAPAFGLGLEDKRELSRLLLASGAPIQDLNTVRKHLSLVKGGRLAAAFHPATLVNLVLSDVMGDDLSVIASGATVPDPSSWAEAWAALEAARVVDRLPARVRSVFEDGLQGRLEDTPKPGDARLSRCENLLVGSLAPSVEAARLRASELGYRASVLSTRLEGEARELGAGFAAIALDTLRGLGPDEAPRCILAGGESTVTLRGDGLGGRNQEMALAFLVAAEGSGLDLDRVTFMSAATDGDDGPTRAAGGIADAATLARARALGLDAQAALDRNDSNPFLAAAGGLLVTGPTNTNVCDLQVLLVGGPPRSAT